jgi:hypothetical protein
VAPSTGDAAALRETLARLRAEGPRLQARSPEAVLASLGALLERLRDPGAPERRSLEEALPSATGFSPAAVREGLTLALDEWTREALGELARAELGAGLGARGRRRAQGFPVTAVLLAGALPSPTIAAMVAPLLLRSPVLVKPSVHDPITAPRVAEALAAVDPDLGRAVAVASFRGSEEAALEAFLEADCVVATGSDETVGRVAARVRPPRRVVAYGHRISVAVLGAHATTGAALEGAAAALALDVALWDQLGCLSPAAAWLYAPSGRIGSEQLDILANAFAEVGRRIPRGRVSPAAAAAIADERGSAELRAASGQAVALREGDGFTLVAEPDPSFRGSPLHRFLRLHPFRDGDELAAALRPLAPHLAAVGVAGLGGGDPLLAALASLGASRICPLGRMQAPPLGWCHDGQGLLLPLARLSDLEVPG